MLEEQNGLRPRSLFQIILKVLGIFFLRDIVYLLPGLVSVLAMANRPEYQMMSIVFGLCQIAVLVSLSWLLLFKTDLLIERLRLDEGFLEQTIPVNVHRSTVLSLAVVITAGLVVVNATADLLRSVLQYSFYPQTEFTRADWSIMVYPAAQLILGLLMIGYNRQLVLWLEQRRKKGL